MPYEVQLKCHFQHLAILKLHSYLLKACARAPAFLLPRIARIRAKAPAENCPDPGDAPANLGRRVLLGSGQNTTAEIGRELPGSGQKPAGVFCTDPLRYHIISPSTVV